MEGVNRIMPVNASSFPAPNAAAIAAAVAAPSAATIATAVAAAVPTTAGITSIVQANAGSPFGGSWTYLGGSNPSGTNIASITGLSGYKKYRLYTTLYFSGNSWEVGLRVNGITTGYQQHMKLARNGQTTAYGANNSYNNNYFNMCPQTIYNGFLFGAIIEFEQASSNQWKTFDVKGGYYAASSYDGFLEGVGFVRDANPITSISITNLSGNFSTTTGTGIYLYGGS